MKSQRERKLSIGCVAGGFRQGIIKINIIPDLFENADHWFAVEREKGFLLC